MSTFTQLVDEVKSKLVGYTMRQDRITYLDTVGGIDAAATSFIIGSADNLSKGIVEIDDELVWVDSFDVSQLKMNVIPGFGRAYQGTTATSHLRYAPVTLTPTFPRSVIKTAINATIRSLYPKLFAVMNTTFTFSNAVSTYALPATCQNVIAASWQEIGPSKEWTRIRRFRPDSMANTTAFGTPNTISIHEGIPSGRTVQVTYAAIPTPLVGNSDDFTGVSGLPASCEDIVVLGACHRLLAFVDAGRLNFTSAEADVANSKIPASAGQSAAKYIFALYQQRLSEESAKMLGQYQSTLRYVN